MPSRSWRCAHRQVHCISRTSCAAAVWKLVEGGHTVRKECAAYVMSASDDALSLLDDLARLVAFADTMYDHMWIGTHITLSA
jgi:hypothetical protein